MTQKILIGNREELEQKAANLIEEKINLLLKEKIILGFPGGTSVSGILQNLAKKNLNWEKIHIFLVDERITPDKKETNFHIINENFLRKIEIPKENIHRFENLEKYNEEFKSLFEYFDIILLSSGEDGHVASLFPQGVLHGENFIKIDNSPKPPSTRMSASLKLLEKSKISFLLFFTKNKKQAYKKFLDESVALEDCPAKLVNETEESYVFVDEEILD